MNDCGCKKEINDYMLVVTENLRLADRVFWMTFKSPELANTARAGNCVMVYPERGTDPLLGRPFAVADTDKERGEFSICYMILGRGTEMLKEVKSGEVLRVRAFIGKPYPDSAKDLIVAGGGAGAAAMMLKKKQREGKCELYIGLPGKGYEAFAKKVLSIHPDAKIFTDDGSFGEGDSMFKALPRTLGEGQQVWCSGPPGFIEAMNNFYKDFPQNLYLILDKRMACGYGGCMGCVIETTSGPMRLCADRSIFRADEVNIYDN